MKKPVILTILDGYGLREEERGNAVKLADNKIFNMLWQKYPHTTLVASGEEVGLPKGQMGNSEVGHMNIGAGRIVYQPLETINKSIEDKSLFKNKELLATMKHVKSNNSKLHIVGLLSDGGVHSHIDHLLALLDMSKQQNIDKLYLHLFTDGRDVSPTSAISYLNRVEDKLKDIGIGSISSIGGRYYGMDRDNNYDRLQKAYDVIVNGVGPRANNVAEYINNSYKKNITDEFLIPTIFDESGHIEDNDGVVTFNFRKDRLSELFTALTDETFKDMPVIKFSNLKVVTMFPVTKTVKAPHAFDDPNLSNTLGNYIEKMGLSQLRIAETEKYAHVTFFFDGGKEINYKNEKKILIPSPKVATYDLKPEMSAEEITKELLSNIRDFDLIILNFANGDMVGHTGVLDAAIRGVEVVDSCLEKIYNAIKKENGILVVTADHGNCEEMLDEEDNIITSHTTNLVPFIVTENNIILKEGRLCDIAPTILDLMNLSKPKEMTGVSLIKRKKSLIEEKLH